MDETIWFYVTKGANLLSDSTKHSRCMLANEVEGIKKAMERDGTLDQYDWYSLVNLPVE
jgi:hypothetical protein